MDSFTFAFTIRGQKFTYQASKQALAFHRDNSLVRGLMGPFGSGKTTACCFEIMRRILEQPRSYSTDKAESRVLIIRNTYQQLRDTSLKTWLSLFPEEIFGKFSYTEMVHRIRLPKIKADVMFRALDRPQDERKLLSMEVTWVFVNEARELPIEIVQMLPRRLRFPRVQSAPPFLQGVIMDSNPTDTDHWWYRLFEEQKQEEWQLFKQPSGISPEAENLLNLPPGYYTSQMAGMPEEWLKVYRDGNYGFVRGQNAVYPEYEDNVHCQDFRAMPGLPIWIGLDFGRTPAAILCQADAVGCWWVLDELTTWNMGAVEFAELLKNHLSQYYQDFSYNIFGDPAGGQKSQTDSCTVYDILAAHGILARPTYTNQAFIRREALRSLLKKDKSGGSKFVVHPRCKVLRKALNGGFCYIKGTSSLDLSPIVEKNLYSHPVEALEYAILGAGLDSAVFQPNKNHSAKRWPMHVQLEFGRDWLAGH